MQIVLISDTHTRHKNLTLPDGDILIHAGDFTGRGEPWAVRNFMDWFAAQPHTHKIVIAGNHDFLAEEKPDEFAALVPENVTYLNDSGTTIEGIHIWGSPIQPEFYDWAFNRQRGADIRRHWDLIPTETDILITHGPPANILDRCINGDKVGCVDLRNRILEVQPRIHVFGHIHEAYGEHHEDGVHYINASSLDHRYLPVHDPIVVDYEM